MPINKSAVKFIMDELKNEITKQEIYLGSLNRQLEPQKLKEKRIKKNRFLDDKDSILLNLILMLIYQNLKNIHLIERFQNFILLLWNSLIFTGVPKEEQNTFVKSTYEKRYQQDEILNKKDMTYQNIYIIQRGSVADEVGKHILKKGLGSLLSYVNLFGDGKCMSTTRATSENFLHSLNLNGFKSMMQKSKYLCIPLKKFYLNLNHPNQIHYKHNLIRDLQMDHIVNLHTKFMDHRLGVKINKIQYFPLYNYEQQLYSSSSLSIIQT